MKKFLAQFADNKKLALILIVINLAGVAFGFFYYHNQFLETPWYLLAFVPDSPTAVFLFAIFLYLHTFKKYQHQALNLLTAVYLAKTGIWTVFVIALFWPSFFVLDAGFYTFNVLLHAGMVAQSLVVWSVWKRRVRKEHALLVLGWFALGDFMDYVIGTVPYPVPFIAGSYLSTLTTESVLSTFILWYLFYTNVRTRSR